MKHIWIIFAAWLMIHQAGGDLFVCKNARISIYSSAPIEDISAVSQSGASVFNASTSELDFKAPIRSFRFDKSLMEEHFNSDYMESDKFPMAIFKGHLAQEVDLSRDGAYKVMVSGDLTIHGVTCKRTISGLVRVRGGIVSMSAEFMVKCADHHITIPSIVFHHIAESIRVDVSATYIVYNSQLIK
jgi:hypothetical protein